MVERGVNGQLGWSLAAEIDRVKPSKVNAWIWLSGYLSGVGRVKGMGLNLPGSVPTSSHEVGSMESSEKNTVLQ